MKKILLFVLAIITLSNANAQLSDGTIAPDFTVTDLDGNVHHLYDYLNAGKTVYIDFFATWCGPCWNYHNTHAFEDLYSEYGPNGTDEVMCFGIEADFATSEDCMYDINCPSSQGDWTAGVDYPQINLTGSNGPSVASDYHIAYYPTIYAICPNTKKVYEVGQRNKTGLYNFIATCQPPPLLYSYLTTDIHCTLNDVGAINLTVSGGEPPYTYTWSNGKVTEDISGLAPGSYTVTIKDAFNTTLVSEAITINGPSSLVQLDLTDNNTATCDQSNGNATVQASGGTSGYSYIWSNGGNGSSIQNVPGGLYSVTVTDGDNCTTQLSVEIENIPSPTVIIQQTGPDLSCDNNSTTLGSQGSSYGDDYTYQWSTDGGSILSDPSATDITVGSGGIYILTINDIINGCTNTNFFTVSSLEGAPDADGGPDKSMSCDGGTLTLDGSNSSNGTNFTYEWSTTDGNIVSDPNQKTIQVNQIGTYTLKVTNTFNDCSAVDQVVVSSTGQFNFTEEVHNLLCFGDNDGSIQLSNNNYSFAWSNGETDSGISGLSAGTYSVTVSSSGGCESSKTYTITQPTQIQISLSGESETGPNANDGHIESSVSGGVGGNSYEWSNGATTPSISGLEPGVYTLTVTNANGCQAVSTYTINKFGCQLQVSSSSTNINCYGNNNGSIQINVVDPQGSYTISWNDGGTGLERTDLTAGTYRAIVTDSTGCVVEKEIVITEPAKISVEKAEVDAPICPGDLNGSISIQSGGGTGNYSYLWSTGSTNNSIIDLGEGDYSVTITDDSGCSSVTSFTLETPNPVTMDSSRVSSDGNGKGTIQIFLNNEWPGNLKYNWTKDGANFAQTKNLTGLDKGVYVLTVTTEAGCVFGPFTFDLSKLKVTDKVFSAALLISPNPATETVNIDNIGTYNQVRISLLDQMGKKVLMSIQKNSTDKASVDVSSLKAGIYYIMIDTGEKVGVKKLIIQQ